ncbi:hypothetical protein BGZ94_000272, partial [Podila epigama]
VNTNFKGLNGLKIVDYVYLIDQNFDFVANKLTMSTIVNLKNPSNLTLKLGDISFNTAAAGGHVGISNIKNLVLVPGNNYVISATTLDMTLDATTDFLNGLSQADGALKLTGYSGTSSDVVLNAALGHLESTLVIPKDFAGSTVSQTPYKNWKLKVLSSTKNDRIVEVTGTFQSPYYGYPFQMTHDEPEFEDNYATIINASPGIDGVRLFEFRDNLTFSVSGTGSVTVTFQANIVQFVAGDRARIQQLISHASANGGIDVNLWWLVNGIINNDGAERTLDWGTSGIGQDVKIATGPDFGQILDSVPA